METEKIAFACFIGGLICSAVALMFTPTFWWFGLIAGLAGGYLSYEFREVCRAVPVALRRAGGKSKGFLDDRVADARGWLAEPHPFLYPSILIVIPVHQLLFHYVVHATGYVSKSEEIVFFVMLTILQLAVLHMFAYICSVPLALLAFIGSRVGESCYCWPFMTSDTLSDSALEREIQSLKERGYRRAPLTYTNAYRWIAKGIGISVLFFIWTLWKYVAIGVWAVVCFLGRFAWQMFKLIHSKKRVLCAIHGTLGGLVSYLWLVSASMSFPQQVVLVLFGGCLGALFGIAAWEIISKRVLHVTIMEP